MSRLLRILCIPLRHPLPWLLIQVVSVFLALHAGHLLDPEIVPDTPSYRILAETGTPAKVLSSHRTYGYPFFLRAIGHRADGRIGGSHARFTHRVFRKVPTVHAVVFLASILLFWWSVRVYTGSPWLAFAMAMPLPYASIWALVRRVQPDFLAAALALITISLFLLLVTRPRAWLWASLTASLFLTYQVRPGYLFLVGLLPFIGPVLWCAVHGKPMRQLWRFEVGLLGTAVLPLLVFCGVRWWVVGDFGLVPFGGYNSIGIAASFLDRDVVETLDRNKALANKILNQRANREMAPMPLGVHSVLWHDQHNTNVWRIAVPAARQQVKAESHVRATTIEVNRLLTQLSWDIFRRKPMHYLLWVRDSTVYCLTRAFADLWIRWSTVLISLSVPTLLLAGAASKLLDPEPRDLERRRRLLALAALGFGFFLAQALLVVLVDVPYARFIYGMQLLLPPVFCGALFELWYQA